MFRVRRSPQASFFRNEKQLGQELVHIHVLTHCVFLEFISHVPVFVVRAAFTADGCLLTEIDCSRTCLEVNCPASLSRRGLRSLSFLGGENCNCYSCTGPA